MFVSSSNMATACRTAQIWLKLNEWKRKVIHKKGNLFDADVLSNNQLICFGANKIRDLIEKVLDYFFPGEECVDRTEKM